MQAQKYGRTFHFPFSLGTSNDDKIQYDWQAILSSPLVITEKLDGENTCLKTSGVYARSHAAPTLNPWANNMQEIWERVKRELSDLEVFGENLYGIHSIEYQKLPAFFFVFAIRHHKTWLSWEEVNFYAELLGLPLVPVLAEGIFSEAALQKMVINCTSAPSKFGGTCEGVVVRTAHACHEDVFSQNVLKYVRANHVQTDEHWTRHWRKASLRHY